MANPDSAPAQQLPPRRSWWRRHWWLVTLLAIGVAAWLLWPVPGLPPPGFDTCTTTRFSALIGRDACDWGMSIYD